jgi:hypothetical protein
MKTAIAMNRIGGKSNSEGAIKTFFKKVNGILKQCHQASGFWTFWRIN